MGRDLVKIVTATAAFATIMGAWCMACIMSREVSGTIATAIIAIGCVVAIYVLVGDEFDGKNGNTRR